MLDSLKSRIVSLVINKNLRSEKIVKNIFMSFGVKGGSILVGLILVPLTIDYITALEYGIWLTISSIISWMSFFDIGLGNGLRNKLAESLALKKYEDARTYVSTTYAILTIISTLLFLTFVFINPWLEWNRILNIPTSVRSDISIVILIVVGSFCIQFVAQLVNTILIANQEPAFAGLILFIGQIGVLLSVFILKNTVVGSLEVLVLALTISPLVALLLASIILFRSRFANISPSFSKVDFSYSKNLLNVGGAFFLIQIGALALLQTNNIILTKMIGPNAVTEFNVVYRLFSVISMLFTIVMTPYWSAFTDAYVKGEYEWMKMNVVKIRKFWLLLSVIAIPLLYFASDSIFRIWLGNSVKISPSLSLSMAFFTISYSALMLNSYFLNGIGKVKMQLYLYVFASIINIPLGIYWTRTFGAEGVVLANILVTTIMNIVLWIQCNKILSRSDSGVWGR